MPLFSFIGDTAGVVSASFMHFDDLKSCYNCFSTRPLHSLLQSLCGSQPDCIYREAVLTFPLLVQRGRDTMRLREEEELIFFACFESTSYFHRKIVVSFSAFPVNPAPSLSQTLTHLFSPQTVT